jgi:DNA-binding GntR family transcriptional regulator
MRARNLLAVADALALVRRPADIPGPTPTPSRDASLKAFLQSLEDVVPAHAEVLLLVGGEPDAAVRDTIDAWVRQRPGLQQHFVPAGASWLDAAELLLTNTPPGHETGYAVSLPALREALRTWCETWRQSAAAFAWAGPTYDSALKNREQRDRPTVDDHRIAGVTKVTTAVESAASELSDPVVQHILEALLAARLPSGEKVRESPLATRLGLSRRVVRRALRGLAEEGLLERSPGGGTVVPRVDIATVLDLYAARAALGTVLMRRAAMLDASALHPVRAALAEVRTVAHRSDHSRIGEADLRFQDAVARVANLPQAGLFFQRLTLRVRMFIAVLGLDFADEAAGLIAREDARIFESICEGDGDEAARLWRVKVERSVRYMSTQLPGDTFDSNLWSTIAGKPTSRPGDPRKTPASPSP